jgi:hypothetical protein
MAAPVTPTSFSMKVRGHLCPAVMFILILPNNSPSHAFRKPGPTRSGAAAPQVVERHIPPITPGTCVVFDIFDLQTCVYFELVIWSWY